MKKKVWMLVVASVCGMSSFAVASDCENCGTPPISTTHEEKKDETVSAEVVVVDVAAEEVASN